ncbi:MAG TPA: amidohydrolase family protein [Trebonia sp.]
MTVIDAHVHLWDLAARPQPWTAAFPVLRRSFLLPELERVLDEHGTDAAVVVQAGDTTDETLDLLALAGTTPRLAGVVGWVDLDRPDVGRDLAALRAAPGGSKLVAVRHQLQVEPDPRYLGRPSVRNGLTAVAEAGLAYDVVVSPWQLPLVTETAAALPGTRFVLDHAGKPPVASGDLRAWRADLARLAEFPNVAVKLGGLVTEADWATWTQAELTPVLGHALTCFGADRAMAGSDWPVCLLAAGYGAVQAMLNPVLGRLDALGRAAVLGGTAAHWYLTSG